MGLVNPGFSIVMEDESLVEALKTFIPDDEVCAITMNAFATLTCVPATDGDVWL